MDYQFENVICILCKSNNYLNITNKGRHGFPTNVVICKECGLVYLNPRWNAKSYMDFYQNEYDKYYRPEVIEPTSISKDPNNIIEKRLKKFNLYPSAVTNILDIGSGQGENLKQFQSLFPNSELFAIEPSPDCQIHLKKFGVTVIEEDVNSSWDKNHQNQFDLIIMKHVLEHFLDPLEVMKKIQSTLKPSGLVYIGVPNTLVTKGDLETFWFRVVHTYYFNKYSLTNLLGMASLDVLKMVEGDELHGTELYCFARKGTSVSPPNFSDSHYREQVSFLQRKLKSQRSVLKKAIKIIKSCLRGIFGLKFIKFCKKIF